MVLPPGEWILNKSLDKTFDKVADSWDGTCQSNIYVQLRSWYFL